MPNVLSRVKTIGLYLLNEAKWSLSPSNSL